VGGWRVTAQEQPSTAAGAGPPPLQAWMFPSIRSDLQFALSDSAYVAMFEISPGPGVELPGAEVFGCSAPATSYRPVRRLRAAMPFVFCGFNRTDR
jgi:hypothetical protein